MNVYHIYCEVDGTRKIFKQSDGWVFKDSSDGIYLFENKSIPQTHFFPIAKTLITITQE